MIRTQLTTALTAAGCTRVIYESLQMANITADQILQTDIVGLILEPDSMTLDVKSNGVYEHYNPTVEIFKQVKPEDIAANNEAVLQSTLNVAKLFINSLVRSKGFQKIGNTPITKITERRYDANVLGWSLLMDLQPITNQLNC